MAENHRNFKTINFRGKERPLGFKVVTKNLCSLGLRKNPNILQFALGQWFYLDKEDICFGKGDWGGIWAARTQSNAFKLQDYMFEKYSNETRVFKAALGDILYHNSYRIKTSGLCMFEEIER